MKIGFTAMKHQKFHSTSLVVSTTMLSEWTNLEGGELYDSKSNRVQQVS